MKNVSRNFQGFTLIEMLLVMSIFIIISATGITALNSTKETFTANENAELIIQDIESIKLRAMNMSKGDENTWIYGFGIDFRNVDSSNGKNGDYNMYKWCSPVKNFGDTFYLNGTPYDLTRAKLPNFFSSYNINTEIPNISLCGVPASYKNGSLPAFCGDENNGYENVCTVGSTNLVSMLGETSLLLDRFDGQVTLLDLKGESDPPSFVLFESLTGKAIIYSRSGKILNYTSDGNFNTNDFVPLDIVLRRKSNKNSFDLITIYPLSGEVIHHVYNSKDESDSVSTDCLNDLMCFTFNGKIYERYGIDDEIKSYRD